MMVVGAGQMQAAHSYPTSQHSLKLQGIPRTFNSLSDHLSFSLFLLNNPEILTGSLLQSSHIVWSSHLHP